MTLLGLVIAGAAGSFQDPGGEAEAGVPVNGFVLPFPAGYLDHAGLTAALERLATAQPDRIHLESLARSAEGREVWLVRVGPRVLVAGRAEARPALLIVANAEADHVVGSQVALGLLESIAGQLAAGGEAAGWLDGCTLYVVPRLNPDGVEALLRAPQAPIRTNLRPIDRDRDGQAGEDGPDDLDGDGVITTMRVRDTASSLIGEPGDARIARPAVSADGEAAAFSEYVEGLDNDGDGLVNEDPPGGVNLNRNWPHRWPEFDLEAGPTPVGEPETRALVRFAFDHPEIAAVWVLGLDESLREEPKKPSAPYDESDLPLFVSLHKAYRKALEGAPKAVDEPGPLKPEVERVGTAIPEPGPPGQALAVAPEGALRPLGLDGTTDGSITAWAYQQLGVVAVSSRLWTGPDLPEAKSGEKDGPPKSGEARWLYWNDRVLGGAGFRPFQRFEHPSLGTVSIGGWKAGVRTNPPAARIEAITKLHAAFLEELAGRLPRLEVPVATATARGPGLYEVRAVVRNTGRWPTATAQGARTRQAPPVIVRLVAGEGMTILAGRRPFERINALDGEGGQQELRWIVGVEGASPGPLRLEVSCSKAGQVVQEIALP